MKYVLFEHKKMHPTEGMNVNVVHITESLAKEEFLYL